ncbi:MAG: YceI family protein [Silvanigrellales bacterium]|jgi:polyisoprenoid-binding protein YceI|nr:YceI family protein [Silvanigrellales bacterium]
MSNFANTTLFSVALVALCASASSIAFGNTAPAKGASKASQTSSKGTALVVDASKSKVLWVGRKKLGSSHNGEIGFKSGSVTMGPKTLTGGELVIDMTSLTVTDIPATDENNAKLDGHLEAADFFDVAKHPTSTLVVTSAKDLGEGKHEVKGKITIKGATQNVTFPVEVKQANGETVAMGKLTLDRTKFGVKYASGNFFKLAADKVIEDNFDLEFTVVAK